MRTIRDFFAREHANIDRTINQIQMTIQASPSMNGRFAGMMALLEVKYNHRRIIDMLAAQSYDLDSALNACRLRLAAVQRVHNQIAAQGGARNLRCAEEWWNTLNELEFLAALGSRLQDALEQQQAREKREIDKQEAQFSAPPTDNGRLNR